ncbi:hypothetical protein BJX99DRAFT_216969 [Aspergillus californicus]
MADDTREPTTPTSTLEDGTELPPQPQRKHEPSQSQAGKLWDAFGNPEEPVNMLPNATGKKATSPSVTDAIKSFSPFNNGSFYKAPCARDSLMLGIGAGFAVGGVRGVLGGLRSIWIASNWAVGAFALTSLGAHEFCQRRRAEELDGMKQAVDMMKELKLKKQREKEQQVAEAARLVEEERKRKSWTHLPNYKFW